jgi:hypothetical protein
MWQGWISFLLGIWLIISGLTPVLQYPINLILVGVLSIIFGFWGIKSWSEAINAILGIWIVVSALAYNMIISQNFLVIGIAMGIFGLWSGLSRPEEERLHHIAR